MVLVPVGTSVIDIAVDGVSLVAGDEVNGDKQYSLDTDYTGRVYADGNYVTSKRVNSDTNFSLSTSTSGEAISFSNSDSRSDDDGNGNFHFITANNAEDIYIDYYLEDYGTSDSISLVVDGNTVANSNHSNGGEESGTWSGSGSVVKVTWSVSSGSSYSYGVKYDISGTFTPDVSVTVSE